MPKTRRPYTPEFRKQMVELVRADRTPKLLFGKTWQRDSAQQWPLSVDGCAILGSIRWMATSEILMCNRLSIRSSARFHRVSKQRSAYI